MGCDSWPWTISVAPWGVDGASRTLPGDPVPSARVGPHCSFPARGSGPRNGHSESTRPVRCATSARLSPPAVPGPASKRSSGSGVESPTRTGLAPVSRPAMAGASPTTPKARDSVSATDVTWTCLGRQARERERYDPYLTGDTRCRRPANQRRGESGQNSPGASTTRRDTQTGGWSPRGPRGGADRALGFPNSLLAVGGGVGSGTDNRNVAILRFFRCGFPTNPSPLAPCLAVYYRHAALPRSVRR
jgi:hypothetical protein